MNFEISRQCKFAAFWSFLHVLTPVLDLIFRISMDSDIYESQEVGVGVEVVLTKKCIIFPDFSRLGSIKFSRLW